MADRNALIADFIAGSPWAGAIRAVLAGDASNRRYDRLTEPGTGKTAILMDAPPEKGEDVRPFVRIAEHLSAAGLSAPQIIAQDAENGLLILEDLGDDLFSRVLRARPDNEPLLYETATDVLVALHQVPAPTLEAYDPPLMTDLACLAFDKYAALVTGDPATKARSRFADRFQDILKQTTTGAPPVLVQRDYHADNLLWLPDRDGVARVGLLDFQDAMLGHPAYDLVSLLQDVRRDVSPAVEARNITHYIEQTGCDDHAFRTAYAALGAQRNLRILGVFGRLGHDYGKPQYVDMIPKVWDLLMADLEHPVLAPVADLLRDALPTPTPDALTGLRAA
ncbi:MAG: aminoglycoside phosphotransferase [Pseudooceanicola sp.]|nr:aminoglycoside phosphotransferase [Pseudooceanicola sp.]|tara:strand:+ start:3124 stop:4131 length:1008 start_codon:yes stop_codon:yes gene_type:complete